MKSRKSPISIDAHQKELLEVGYTQIKEVYDPATIQEAQQKLSQICESTPLPEVEKNPNIYQGHQIFYSLQNRDIFFFRLMLKIPEIRSLLMLGLNDPSYYQIPKENPNFILRGLIARSAGARPLHLHTDAFLPSSGVQTWSMQVAIILEEQSPVNGCTIFLPRSHRVDRLPEQSALSMAVPVTSKPGDVLIWDSRIWHGTTGNTTPKSRWSIIATFVRWWVKQNFDITGVLPPEIYSQLTNEEKAVMGFCSRPPTREDREIKGGYEVLQ